MIRLIIGLLIVIVFNLGICSKNYIKHLNSITLKLGIKCVCYLDIQKKWKKVYLIVLKKKGNSEHNCQISRKGLFSHSCS